MCVSVWRVGWDGVGGGGGGVAGEGVGVGAGVGVGYYCWVCFVLSDFVRLILSLSPLSPFLCVT